jgi:N-acetylglutamate synthase-like GNAT family acetyltransferase
MYVRNAKNHEEVWLLDRLDELGLSDPAFRSRDYVVALDEETNEKAGFGRVRTHPSDPSVCELATVGVLPEWRDSGVAAHIVERLVERAGDEGFETVYSVTGEAPFLSQFGFEPVPGAELPEQIADRLSEVREEEPDTVPMAVEVEAFEMPDRHREQFKQADTDGDDEPEESPEDFGIDPEDATYKYDTGR